MDFLITVLLLPIAAPIIALLWCLVRLDGGPGFFEHTRVGPNRRLFRCYKLRTMGRGARKKLKDHLAHSATARREWRSTQKLQSDPRTTRVGRFLRATSLDELPQLLNVLKGDMGLVGPRPVTPGELHRYAGFEFAYDTYRPGLTGLWQVSDRSTSTFDDRVAFDVAYLMRASVLCDVKILALTLFAVLRRTGV